MTGNLTAEATAQLDLVSRARAGDQSAFSELVRQLQRRIVRLALGMLGDAAAAEDVAQETFLRAYRNLRSFRSEASFATWTYRIAVNLCLGQGRKDNRVGREDAPLDEHELVDHSPSPESTAETAQHLERLEEGLQVLSGDHRAILLLREVEGLSYQEISDVLVIPKGTVMSRLFHARGNLRRACGRAF